MDMGVHGVFLENVSNSGEKYFYECRPGFGWQPRADTYQD